MNESERILIDKNWLSPKECKYFILLYETFWSPEIGEEYHGYRAIDYFVFTGSAEIKLYLRGVTERLRDRIQEFFGVTGLVLESFFLAALLEGGFHEAHADNEKYAGHKWVPNHTPQRDYTAILYLNSDFGGGDLCFPQHKLCISPESGLLVVFPSSRDFIHSVRRVRRGTRYSMPFWFTKDVRFAAVLAND
jgi:hypothetical protein